MTHVSYHIHFESTKEHNLLFIIFMVGWFFFIFLCSLIILSISYMHIVFTSFLLSLLSNSSCVHPLSLKLSFYSFYCYLYMLPTMYIWCCSHVCLFTVYRSVLNQTNKDLDLGEKRFSLPQLSLTGTLILSWGLIKFPIHVGIWNFVVIMKPGSDKYIVMISQFYHSYHVWKTFCPTKISGTLAIEVFLPCSLNISCRDSIVDV